MTIQRTPLLIALLPVFILISLLTLNVFIFKDDAVSGSNQIILILSGAIAALLAIKLGHKWIDLEKGVVNAIKIATPAILILLMVGALSGAWLVSGIIPTMIYYGLHILNPSFFLVAACLICICVSLFTGSSWTTSATVGIALIGIGKVLGLNEGMIAGAILSGAYFGDKLSPLSDTTNLASASTGTELFTHIRYMCFTTVPSILISMVLFLILGFGTNDVAETSNVEAIIQSLDASFNITPMLLIVPAAVVFMIVKRIPALPSLLGGTILGIVCAYIFQYDKLVQVGSDAGAQEHVLYVGMMQTLFGDTAMVTGNETLDELLNAGGMGGMLTTIWLIISAMIFGGIMESSGFLKAITEALIEKVKSVGSLVSATAGTCMFFNVSASDQYLAVLLPGRMYAEAYKKRGLAPQNLSRTIEDSGTVTSVLVPWNTCGAFHASVLGVATIAYAPFAFFCLISPIMTIAFAYLKLRIAELEAEEKNSNERTQSAEKIEA